MSKASTSGSGLTDSPGKPARRSSIAEKYLDPATSMGEVLFGLIMTLTFTLGAGMIIEEEGREGARQLLIATIGCNIAWGIIDGALYLAGQLFDRGRLRKLTAIVHDASDDNTASAVVADELDGVLEQVITEPERRDLYGRIVRNIRSSPVRAANKITKADMLGALASFWLVFLASLPAAVPFMLMDDAMQALRMSNVILLALLFFTGYRWAKYTLGHPWIVGLCFLIGGIAMVWTAIMLGGADDGHELRAASPDITRTTLTVLIIGILIVGSLWTLLPFIGALVWATAIVVATWPLLLWVQARVGGSRALATTIMTLIVAIVVIVPFWVAISALLDASTNVIEIVRSYLANGLGPPPSWLANIPVAGRATDRAMERARGGRSRSIRGNDPPLRAHGCGNDGRAHRRHRRTHRALPADGDPRGRSLRDGRNCGARRHMHSRVASEGTAAKKLSSSPGNPFAAWRSVWWLPRSCNRRSPAWDCGSAACRTPDC